MGIIGTPGLLNIWAMSSAEAAGLDPAMKDHLTDGVARGAFPGLHAAIVLRHGRPVLEQYFSGRDALWGTDLGTVEHGPARLHDVRSITKSVVSLLYGIALADGLVPPTETRLSTLYPAYAAFFTDTRKQRITIGHVLSMRMGIDWREGTDYDNPANSENEMEAAPDRIGFVLSRAAATRPGLQWLYCGGATVLLGDLIARGAGMSLDAYAERALFTPMGFGETHWVRSRDGLPAASSGLRLLPRDLACLGQMILNRGGWGGRQIVPRGWLATSFKPRATIEPGLRYGYHWWLGRLLADGKPWQAAFGNGGQRLFIIPSLDMVVVVLAGNYNAPDQWKMPAQIMSRIVMPAIRKA